MSASKKMCSEASEEDYMRNVMLDDLQLAAELGKTLLERNKELETALKQHQNVIEDQAQEIEYLTKQTAALREVNDSRLRIYEQLEVSIQDLERANHRLVLDNSAEKKHVKSLNTTIESLEAKCEDLQSTCDDLRLQVDALKRRTQRPSDNHATPKETVRLRHHDCKYDEENQSATPDSSGARTQEKCTKASPKERASPSQMTSDVNGSGTTLSDEDMELDSSTEQMSLLLTQLSKTRVQCSRDERRIMELEEQLATLVQQNQSLEGQVVELSHRGEESNMKSMQEELTTLEEVRQGQMCSRCLRSVDRTDSEVLEDDDLSMLDALMQMSPQPEYRSSFHMDLQECDQSPPAIKKSDNPYKELVEKYEALVEVHNKPIRSKPDNCLSLQEEMQMSGDFTISVKDTDEESGHGDSLRTEKLHKKTRKTPTDFSEAETSSSGFADETSNKGTQTEGRVGSFLCTIADGDDCKFSIYDDASPIDSRFRDRPEYRDLFKEIFNVLKKAAENKEEGDDLPLLDDFTPIKVAPKVPPVTPSNDQLPEFPDDDTQSVVSSTMSELSTSQNEPTTVIENIIQAQNRPIPEAEPEPETPSKQERILKPLIRQPMEYISVDARKRSSSRRKNKFADRSDSPVTHIIGSPKINYTNRPSSGRRRREHRNPSTENENTSTWNGNTLQFWSTGRNVTSPTPSQGSFKYEFKPSSASQDLHKLKKLDLSYAEVLRNADNKKRELFRQRRK